MWLKRGQIGTLTGSNKHTSVKPVNWPRDAPSARREGKGGGKRAIIIAHSPEMALEAGERVIVSALPPTQAKYNGETGSIVWGLASDSLVVDGKVSGLGFRFRG